MRVVFDTNIYVSAFGIPGGNAEEAYLHAVGGSFELVTSSAILTETANVFRTKFNWSDEKVGKLLGTLSQMATVVKTQPSLHVLTDESDNRILECAIEADANLIVTGDRHLLDLKRYQTITIVKLSDFLRLIRNA
ncbi:MAG: putative toxin-antitoxin system toxin component, PIN family [Nitrospirae bacterium]|nr:MAG: putative toxin-antitoxin system toxin component, PIN family [Nitrospirota bacterium]